MAAPNIVGVTTITGKTVATNLSTNSATVLLSNAADSNYVYKVNTIIVANDDGSNNSNITLTHNSAAAGSGNAVHLAKTVAVAADSTLILLDKASSIYLEEDKSLVATAADSNRLDVIVSYEEIID